MSIKIKFAIMVALFDYNPKMSDAMKPEFCMVGVEELLDLVAKHEDITTGPGSTSWRKSNCWRRLHTRSGEHFFNNFDLPGQDLK